MIDERTLNLELAFLHEQMNALDSKIDHLEYALETCKDPLEASGLQAMLSTVQLEREVLNELIMHQVDAKAVSLEAAILEFERQANRAANGRAQHWQRGHPVPPVYWECQTRQAFLSELLSRYHAWKEERLFHPAADKQATSAPGYAYPWYRSSSQKADLLAEHHSEALALTTKALYDALERAGCRPDHLTITTEPGGFVLATGYAHTPAERDQCAAVLASVEEVQELLTGIVVVEAAQCPICQAQRRNGQTSHALSR